MDEKPTISRRRFLAVAGGSVGVTALACYGLTTLGICQPAVRLTESSYGGENDMQDKILVTFASKCGSTSEVADAIGRTLSEGGAAVDVHPVQDVTDLGPYRAVVIGSAIRMGQWLPEAVKFVETHKDALSQKPVAYFVVCMTMKEDTEENRREVAEYLDPLRAQVTPVAEGLFAGAMDYGKLPIVFRLLIKAMKVPEGDFRDWDGIRAWATDISPTLLS